MYAFIVFIYEIFVYVYNTGYKAGHKDTTEDCYIDISQCDMITFHSDVVYDIVNDLLKLNIKDDKSSHTHG